METRHQSVPITASVITAGSFNTSLYPTVSLWGHLMYLFHPSPSSGPTCVTRMGHLRAPAAAAAVTGSTSASDCPSLRPENYSYAMIHSKKLEHKMSTDRLADSNYRQLSVLPLTNEKPPKSCFCKKKRTKREMDLKCSLK